MNIAGIDHQALVIPLDDKPDARIVAVLHRSLDDALAAFERLRNTLIVLAALSLVLSIIGSVAVARNITRPLETLASAAARIEQGDYGAPVDRAAQRRNRRARFQPESHARQHRRSREAHSQTGV